MNNLSFKNSFFRAVLFTFKSSLKSVKLYIYILILPFFLYVASYLYASSFDSKIVNPAFMIAKLMLPSIFSIFIVTSLISDWNNSIFIKYISIFKLKKTNLTFSVFVVFFILNIIFLLIFLTLCTIFDSFLINQSMLQSLKISTYKQMIDENYISPIVNFRRVFGIMFVLIISFTLSFFTGYTIANLIKNIIWAQVINISLVLITLLTAEQFLNPNDSTFNNFILNFTYFVPYKYLVWLTYLFYIDIQSDSDFINLVIVNLMSNLFIVNYTLPIIFVIFITTCMIFLGFEFYTPIFERIKLWKKS